MAGLHLLSSTAPNLVPSSEAATCCSLSSPSAPIPRGLSGLWWTILLPSFLWITSAPLLSVLLIPKSELPIPEHILPRTPPPEGISTRMPEEFPTRNHSHDTLLRTRDGKRDQGTKYSPNKHKTRYQHLESQSSQTQMPRSQHKKNQ